MRSVIFALSLVFAVNLIAAEAIEQYPIATVNEGAGATDEAGIFRNRQGQPRFRRPQAPAPAPGVPQPGVPDADGNRTAPVDPNAAPKFEPAPGGATAPLSLAELTPEQKQQLFTAISSIISLLIGAFAGSGKMGPFITAILGAFKTIGQPVPPAPAPARTRTRSPKAKAKPKAATPESK